MDENAGDQYEQASPTEAAPAGDQPEQPPSVAQTVNGWAERIKSAKKHWEKDFERIRKDMKYARKGAGDAWNVQEQYTVNIVQRHVSQKTASLYAKNPTAVAKRKKRMEFQVWDGNPQSLQMAQMQAQEAMQAGADPAMVAPQAMQLLQDVQQGMARRQMLDKVGKSTEYLFHYFTSEAEPNFKVQAKTMVRRTITTGVGYVKINFHRAMEASPEASAQVADLTNQLNLVERLTGQAADGELEEDSTDAETLRTTLGGIQSQQDVIVHEGLAFDFPRTTEIIVDPCVRNLKGFIGAGWIAHEFHMEAERAQEVFGIKLQGNYTSYNPTNPGQREPANKKEKGLVCVWEVQDKRTGTVFTIADGYQGYLRDPAAPEFKLERFFNVYTLMFNECESEESPYPPSDVELLRSMQDEYNRARHGLREHRRANRPKYLSTAAQLEQSDKDAIRESEPHSIIELKGLPPGTAAEQVIQPMKHSPIDPALYDTNPHFEDVLRVVGSQEANLGGLSGATATEASIGEQARNTAAGSNIDDLDDLLTEVARGSGQIMLQAMGQEQVKKIAGPGAVWPEWSRQEIADEIYLTIKAGSSGRPNKAQELANMERAMPFLLQLPGVNPQWLAEQMLNRMEDDLDLEEALVEGMPSITAMNAMAKPGTEAPGQGGPAGGQQRSSASGGDQQEAPRQDPNAQGPAGQNNAPSNGQQQGPQPAFPGGMMQ